jgi:hypothetical protein
LARTREIEHQYKEKEIKLQGVLRKTMEQLIQEQTAEISELQGEFQNATSLMEQKYRHLNERFQEITELYD